MCQRHDARTLFSCVHGSVLQHQVCLTPSNGSASCRRPFDTSRAAHALLNSTCRHVCAAASTLCRVARHQSLGVQLAMIPRKGFGSRAVQVLAAVACAEAGGQAGVLRALVEPHHLAALTHMAGSHPLCVLAAWRCSASRCRVPVHWQAGALL